MGVNDELCRVQQEMKPTYLLFDLGNVIVDLDIPATYQAMAALGGGHVEALQSFLEKERWLERYETGAIADDDFVEGILAYARPGITGQDVRDAWNAMLVHIPEERLQWLEGLRQSFRVGLLSNTNGIHLSWVYGYLETAYGIRDFEARCFDDVYYSHQIGYRKPDEACYRHALACIGRPAGEVLFIDDLEENTRAARAIGIRAATHLSGREIREWLPAYLSGGV